MVYDSMDELNKYFIKFVNKGPSLESVYLLNDKNNKV